MVQKIKNNNLAEYRAFQEEKNKELVLKSIKYIKSLNGIINFSTVSQVTYDIADPLKNETGLTLAGLSKNKLYRSIIEKAKLSQNIDMNLKSNRSFYENSSNSNMTVADIKLQLHELRVKNVNLKMENKILSEQNNQKLNQRSFQKNSIHLLQKTICFEPQNQLQMLPKSFRH